MNKYCIKGSKQLERWIQEYNRNHPDDICNIAGTLYEAYYHLRENHKNFRCWNVNATLPENYTLLLFEEFKRIVLDGNQVQEQNFNIWN